MHCFLKTSSKLLCDLVPQFLLAALGVLLQGRLFLLDHL